MLQLPLRIGCEESIAVASVGLIELSGPAQSSVRRWHIGRIFSARLAHATYFVVTTLAGGATTNNVLSLVDQPLTAYWSENHLKIFGNCVNRFDKPRWYAG